MEENNYINNVCKIGQGAECCRYVGMGTNGFECIKLTNLKSVVDSRVNVMVAKGDNCKGKKEIPGDQSIICPECTKIVNQEELDMFGGVCEDCRPPEVAWI